MTNDYYKLLLANKAWVADKLEEDEEYFEKLAADQTPQFLWIGCSDSRVPADQVTDTRPGEIFVHRNVANLVVHTDTNMLSVLQYAVEVLKVKHVIVCGHYGCGGVKAAMTNNDYGLINKWLRNIKEVYAKHETEVRAIDDPKRRFDRMVEINVLEQTQNLVKTTIVQKSWQKYQLPHLHGWVMSLETGLLHEVINISPGSEIDPIFRYDFREDYGH